MTIRCAIFDFDGTLFDSMPIWETAGERFLHSVGREAKPSMREDVRTLSMYQSACYFQREYGLSLTVQEIMNRINEIIAQFYRDTVLPKPGVMDLLRQLRQEGTKLCIATASDRCQIAAALGRCRMTQFFDAIFTCSEVGHGKDEPIIFQRAMEAFGADRSNTVVFEDALHAIQTAKTDGFLVAAVFDASETRQETVKRISDCYLPDFTHREEFWKFVSAI